MEITDLCNTFVTVVAGLINGRKTMLVFMYMHGDRKITDDGIEGLTQKTCRMENENRFKRQPSPHKTTRIQK